MKLHCSLRRNRAMTLMEAVIVIFVLVILVMMLFPASPHRGCQRISCMNNLKQLGLAYKIWAGDNNDKYPMETSGTNGGTMEWMNTPDAWKTFQVMSNELSTPKILYCPKDSLHQDYATNWNDGLKNHISYFIGFDVTQTNLAAFLSGDGNFLLNGSPANHGSVNAASNASLAWDTSRHVTEINDGPLFKTKTGCGNILLGDGSVQGFNNSTLTNQLQQTGLATNRLFIP